MKRMLTAGAAGYVLKQSPGSELVRAVRVVAEGNRYLDPSLEMLDPVPPSSVGEQASSRLDEPLTSDETQVLRLIAAAWTHQRIAEQLNTDVTVVDALRTSAMQKAGLATRIQIITYARSHGWLDVGKGADTP